MQSKAALLGIATFVLLAAGVGLTWFLLQDRNESEATPEASPQEVTAAADETLVELQSDPSGANVLEDDDLIGVTPIQLTPEPGRRLAIDLEGYQRRSIELGPEVPSSYTVELTPTPTDDEGTPQVEFDFEDGSMDESEEASADAPSDDGDDDSPTDDSSRPSNVERDPRPDPTPPPRQEPSPDPEPEEQEVIPVFGEEPDSNSESKPEQPPDKQEEEEDEGEDIPVF